jgi:hypothetical protein
MMRVAPRCRCDATMRSQSVSRASPTPTGSPASRCSRHARRRPACPITPEPPPSQPVENKCTKRAPTPRGGMPSQTLRVVFDSSPLPRGRQPANSFPRSAWECRLRRSASSSIRPNSKRTRPHAPRGNAVPDESRSAFNTIMMVCHEPPVGRSIITDPETTPRPGPRQPPRKSRARRSQPHDLRQAEQRVTASKADQTTNDFRRQPHPDHTPQALIQPTT